MKYKNVSTVTLTYISISIRIFDGFSVLFFFKNTFSWMFVVGQNSIFLLKTLYLYIQRLYAHLQSSMTSKVANEPLRDEQHVAKQSAKQQMVEGRRRSSFAKQQRVEGRRRSSFAMVLGYLEEHANCDVPSLFTPTDDSLAAVSTSTIKSNVKGSIDFVMKSSNIRNSADEFVKINFPMQQSPEATHYYKAYISALLVELKPYLKFARIGAAGRLGFILIMTYQDMITDILVIHAYYVNGDMDSFYTSLSIIVFATFLHVIASIAKNSRRSFAVKIKGVFTSLLLLSPVIESYEYWKDEEQTEETTFDPVLMLIVTRAVELVCESVPESAVQLAVLMKTENPPFLMYFSIVSSVLAAGAIITETGFSAENNAMNAQIRGRGTHFWWGLLPDGNGANVRFAFGLFLFHTAYMYSGILCVVGVMLVFAKRFIFLALACEFVMFMLFVRWRNGSVKYWMSDHMNVHPLDFFQWFICGALMMNFSPMNSLFRGSANLGGRLYFVWICYRQITNWVVVKLTTDRFDQFESIVVDKSVIMTMSSISAWCSILGYLLVFLNARKSHRYQLHSMPLNHRDEMKRMFKNRTLYNNYVDFSECGISHPFGAHPR